MELVVEEKNYYRALYHTMIWEMTTRQESSSRTLTVDNECYASTSAPTIVTPAQPRNNQPLNSALQDRATPSELRERSTPGVIKTDFIPASKAMASSKAIASINLDPPDPPLIPASKAIREGEGRQDLQELRSGSCCECSGCESERENAQETANALLNLSLKTSKLHQEIYQLKLESCMKDQLIFMLRQEESFPEEINNLPPVPPRSHMSLPNSPSKIFHS